MTEQRSREMDVVLEAARAAHQVALAASHIAERQDDAKQQEIARLQQTKQHQAEQAAQLTVQQRTIEEEQLQLQSAQLAMQTELAQLNQQKARLAPAIAEITQQSAALKIAITDQELAAREHRQLLASCERVVAEKRSSIEHMLQTGQQLTKQRELLLATIAQHQAEQAALTEEPYRTVLAQLEVQLPQAVAQLEKTQSALVELEHRLTQCRSHEQERQQELVAVESRCQQLQGQRTALETLQRAALGQADDHKLHWLEQHHLAQQPYLAQHMTVEPGWEQVVESILHDYLQAICVDQPVVALLFNQQDHWPDYSIGFLTRSPSAYERVSQQQAKLLLSKITTAWPLDALLGSVYIADTWHEACALAKQLSGHESVVTQDGLWIGSTWCRLLRADCLSEGSVLQRERQLQQLAELGEQLTAEKQRICKQLAVQEGEIHKVQHEVSELRDQWQAQQAALVECKAEQKIQQANWQAVIQQKRQVECYLAQQMQQLNTLIAEYDALQAPQQEMQAGLAEQEGRLPALRTEQEAADHAVQTLRQQIEQHKEHQHDLLLQQHGIVAREQNIQQTSVQHHQQLARLNERLQASKDAEQQCLLTGEVEHALEQALREQHDLAQAKEAAKVQVQTLWQQVEQQLVQQQVLEQELAEQQQQVTEQRLQWQRWQAKREALEEGQPTLVDTVVECAARLPTDAAAGVWEASLQRVSQQIARLGAVNLVAIDEYQTLLARQQYLDQQIADLEGSVTLLEDAISALDEETRASFLATFEQVHVHFQSLFPEIFNGGQARLELTHDAMVGGVRIVAQPPGKKGTSLQLLSGGEKTLTALSFIFAIFRLNPSPFCLLDEVDAALDDANVVRFTTLIKTMAASTQFLFISHNKVAIAAAHCLIGVTMQEAGLSRVVSVDVDRALELIDS